jgi:hypothetical protein
MRIHIDLENLLDRRVNSGSLSSINSWFVRDNKELSSLSGGGNVYTTGYSFAVWKRLASSLQHLHKVNIVAPTWARLMASQPRFQHQFCL